uniref:Response regulatory domain-containing protein n=1 Tax=Leersia perrieri TaxID=77586 RepID=A0A0D9X8L8_9ORYZ
MDEEMFSFFPGGLRVMLIADDPQDVRTATAMLSLLNYAVVATHSTAMAGLRALSRDNVMDVQAVICDVHKVISSGFDLRCVVETEFHIPVIYLLSTEQTVAGEDVGFLNRLLQRATYIVRKPLDPDTIRQLWRVVAWSKCSLRERRPSDVVDMRTPYGNYYENDNEDVVSIEEPQVHFKAMRSSGSRKRKLISNIYDNNYRNSIGGAGFSKPPKHWFTRTLRLKRKFEYKYRAKQQKKDMDEHRLLSSDHSMFLQAIRPTLNVPRRNPLIRAGGAGPSCVAGAAFAGGSGAAERLQVPVHQKARRTRNDNAVISINNAAVPAAVQAPAMEEQQMSGGVLVEGPPQMLLMGPFPYQGPLPPAMENHIGMLMAMEKGKSPVVEIPFGQPMDDLLVGESSSGSTGPTMESVSQENVPDQVAPEGDIMFCLESLMGMYGDMLLPTEDAAGSVNVEEGGMEIGWDLDRLENILMDDTNEFVFQDNSLAGKE